MKESDPIVIEADPVEEPAAGLQLPDIYYVIFRHKWKILLCSLVGLAFAIGFFLNRVRLYGSEAKLMVRYVLETRAAGPVDIDSQVKTPDSSGNALLNSELEMLSSFDLATNVAIAVGPTNILGSDATDEDAVLAAASAVRKGLEAFVAGRSAIISVRFQHPNPTTARSVVAHAVDEYLKMHSRVHRGSDSRDELVPMRDQHREKLEGIEEALRGLKKDIGVVSLDDKESYREQLASLRKSMFVTEADLAQALAGSGRPVGPEAGVAAEAPPAPAAEKVMAYRNALTRIDLLMRQEQEQSLIYTDESPRIRTLRSKLELAIAERVRLETETPALTNAAGSVARNALASASSGGPDPALVIDGLRAKLKTLNEQSDRVRAELLRIDEKEARITDLERQRKQEESTYVYYATKLETVSLDKAIDPGNMSNIRVIQAASPAQRVAGKTKKLVGGSLAGGLFGGLGLAFLIELLLDQSIRRPAQVERHLRLPLFATIPALRLRQRRNRTLAAPASSEDAVAERLPVAVRGNSETGVSRADSMLKVHVDSLRDRLIMHFRHIGLTHKPKLVGVTGCGRGSGVTTVAAELAASLSETGEGNVLYVDVNPHSAPSIHPFQHGQKLPGISEVLSEEPRKSSQIQENLYVARLDGPSGQRIGAIPRAMASLIPRMRSSAYDYIVFDLPPVTQTSVTSKILGLMDMTFLVVESERTHRDLAKRVVELANGSRDNLAVVLNKQRQYLPDRLDTDL